MRSRALCQDFCKCCFLGSHTCGYHHPHLEPDCLWHRCWILGLLPGLCSWGSLEAEFPHSCPQPALDQASDELSAFDLHAWLSITGHGAPSFPALGPHGNVVFILAGMSPGGAQHQTPSPSFCQAAVVTPTPTPGFLFLACGQEAGLLLGKVREKTGRLGGWREPSQLSDSASDGNNTSLAQRSWCQPRLSCTFSSGTGPASPLPPPSPARILKVSLLTCVKKRCSYWPDYLMVQ